MNTNEQIYKSSNGKQYFLVAMTRGGKYAWFRPIEHRDDAYFDRNFLISSMVQL